MEVDGMRGKGNVSLFVIFNNVRFDLVLLSFRSGGDDSCSEGGKEEEGGNTTVGIVFSLSHYPFPSHLT